MASGAKPIVSFLGPRASYSHQAVLQTFPETSWVLRPAATIDDVFDRVQGRSAVAGVVPVENSSNGPVVFTLDNLVDRDGRYKDIFVHGEIFVSVRHCLAGHKTAPGPGPEDGGSGSVPGSDTGAPTPPELMGQAKPASGLKHIKRLYSHPQAFGQCTAFIAAYLNEAEIFDVSSTSKAAEIVGHDETGASAAISSELAAETHGLDVLVRSIEDREDNTTRFLIIGTTPAVPDDWRLANQPATPCGSKSLASFTVPHSAPGALAHALGCFSECGINLTSINSRPSLRAPFQYIFLVEFEGHRYDDPDGRVKSALDKIGRVAESSRWLGSWKRYR